MEDKLQGGLICEVMEANTYNRYMPLDISGDLTDNDVLESLASIGYQVEEETIYIAKARLMNEASYPIETGSNVRDPKFDEVRDFLIHGDLDSSLVLASIKNTDKLYDQMDETYKGLYHTFEESLKPQGDIPFFFNIKDMVQYPHIGVFGGSGSGKSYGLRVILEELMKKSIPTIIFDPHYEMEFDIDEANPSAGRDYSSDYETFLIGRDVGVDFKDLNPGEFKKLLSATAQLSEAMESAVDLLWREFRTAPDVGTFEIFLDDLLEMFSMEEEEIISKSMGSSQEAKYKYDRLLEYSSKYRKKLAEPTVRAISWRLRSLIFDGVFSRNSTDLVDCLKSGKTCVICGPTRLLQVYGSYLINNVYGQRRDYLDKEGPYFPPFLIITDEAHEFAPKAFDAPSRSILREIAQEGRKYGVFLVFATQRPTLLDETITAQLNSKFIFRTVRGTDIQTIREETDLSSEEAKRLPYLRTGDMFASVASIGRTHFVRVRSAETKKPHVKNPFDELKDKKSKSLDEFNHIIQDLLPIEPDDINQVLLKVEKAGFKLSSQALERQLDLLADGGYIGKTEDFLGRTIYTKENDK